MPESPIRSPSKVDVPGALLLSGGLISLMLALTEGEDWGWGSPRLVGVLALAVVFFVLWGVVEARSSSPMVDLRMLAHRPILLTNIATLISGFALFSCFVLVPTFVETNSSNGYGFSASATVAGLYLLPSSLAMLVAGPLAGAIGRRYGSKWTLATGMLVVSVAALLFATMHADPGPVLLASALLGLGVGAAFASMAGLIADNVDPREMGVAAGMNTVVRMIGGVVGGQVGGGAADRAHDRRHLGPRRVRVHDHVRAQRRDGSDRRGDRGLDQLPPAPQAAGGRRRPPCWRRPPGRARFVRRADAGSTRGPMRPTPRGTQHEVTATEVTTNDRNPDKA